jgi:hypothetical protein
VEVERGWMWMWRYSARGVVNDVLFWLCVGDKRIKSSLGSEAWEW